MTEPTAYDALVAELLADVLKLHDEVKSLKDFLPAQVNAAERRLAGVIALLEKAGDAYREELKAYTQNQGDVVRTQMEKDAHEARLRFRQEYDSQVKEILTRIETTTKSTVAAAITDPVRQITRNQRHSIRNTIALCLASGLTAGMVVYGAIMLTHDLKQEAEADMGRSVVAVWDKLDKKAKAIIDAERKM